MKSSQFDAKTFGVGELISQRKLFRVPAHQRSYAWDKESVEVFLSDIELAIDNDARDHFIGLVVIQASESGEWILLDGQQRLTTVSLIYAAIRYLLTSWGLTADAQQIHHEYLGVRRLGGEFSSRMLLNQENQPVFQVAAIDGLDEDAMKICVGDLCRTGSNKLLLAAVLNCRKWAKGFAEDCEEQSVDAFASRLYEVARFLESQLRVVAVEVSSDVDAYVLFESLNDRGVALSAFDLVKNYIFSKAPNAVEDWAGLSNVLGDENPEDFLKTFWTSRYGLIQKSQIFREVKSKYSDELTVKFLVDHMLQDAAILLALSDDNSLVWNEHAEINRNQVYLLRSLESKQLRPLLIALFRELTDEVLIADCLKSITTAIVRFQVVGKGRTGVVEKVFGRACQQISSGGIRTVHELNRTLSELFIEDELFIDAFRRHQDKRFSRIVYFLSLLASNGGSIAYEDSVGVARNYFESCGVREIFSFLPDADKVYASRIGNFILSPRDKSISLSWPHNIGLTEGGNAAQVIEDRSSALAQMAALVWPVPELR